MQKEETKSLAPLVTPKQDVKNEYLDWQHTDRGKTSRTSSNNRSSSAELEKEAQEVIRDLLVLNQLSSSCLSRTTRENNEFKKHSSSISMYSHTTDTLVSSPLGVIHHPAYRNSYSTVCISSINLYWLKNLLVFVLFFLLFLD